MVPFSDAGLSGTFRLIHVDVAPYSPTLHGVEPSGHARSVTSESTECDSDRISKIRARPPVEKKQGYKTIRGPRLEGVTQIVPPLPPARSLRGTAAFQNHLHLTILATRSRTAGFLMV